jgi:hypothetical protein
MVTPDLPAPLFIVGSMRSGSTMLRLMLDSHPRIAIPSETGFMGAAEATHRIPDWKFGEGWYERLGWSQAEVDERLRDFFDGMFRRYAAEQGKPRWGEKTPFHTAHMARMAQIFPDAGFVGIVRHPGAVASSLRRRFHYGFAEAVTYWSDTNKQMLTAGMALGDRFALCRYEDVVTHGEPVLRELLGFLGEPWAPEVLHHHEVQRERGVPRAVEGRTITSDPVDASRADAWSTTVSDVDRGELARVAELAEFLDYAAQAPHLDDADPASRATPPRWLVTGTELAVRHSVRQVDLTPEDDRRMGLAELGVEELAARLVRTEAALARARSRRAVRAGDAVRRVQHGRSVQDLRAAWRMLRGDSGR